MATDASLVFIYDPRYHTFDSWASLVTEEYAAQQLGNPPTDERMWKDWAVGLNAISLFNNEAIPDPSNFSDWRDWAAAVIGAINQRD